MPSQGSRESLPSSSIQAVGRFISSSTSSDSSFSSSLSSFSPNRTISPSHSNQVKTATSVTTTVIYDGQGKCFQSKTTRWNRDTAGDHNDWRKLIDTNEIRSSPHPPNSNEKQPNSAASSSSVYRPISNSTGVVNVTRREVELLPSSALMHPTLIAYQQEQFRQQELASASASHLPISDRLTTNSTYGAHGRALSPYHNSHPSSSNLTTHTSVWAQFGETSKRIGIGGGLTAAHSNPWKSTAQSSFISPAKQLKYGMDLLEATTGTANNGEEKEEKDEKELTRNGISKRELMRTSHALGYGPTHNNYRTYLNSTNVLPSWISQSQSTQKEEKKVPIK